MVNLLIAKSHFEKCHIYCWFSQTGLHLMLCVHSSIRFDFYAADDYSMQQSGNLSTTSLVEKCVMFKTLNDDLEEGDEVFTISLSIEAILPSTGNALLVNDVVQITILDAFDPPTVMGEGTHMYVYTYMYYRYAYSITLFVYKFFFIN